MNRFAKFAAAAAVIIVVIGFLAWLVPGNGTATIAWADVHEAMQEARTICFEMVVYHGQRTQFRYDILYKEPGLMRMEMPELIGIFDWENGRFLTLIPQSHSAHSGKVTDMDNPYYNNWLDDLREIIGSEQAEAVGEKLIDEREVKGWRVREGQWVTTVWADAHTAELVTVEFTTEASKMVMSNFVFNRELDDSLFAQTPPEDYVFHTKTTMKASDPSIQDVAGLLRIWAGGNGGVFPDNLHPWEFHKASANYDWSSWPGVKDHKAISDMISRGFWFLNVGMGWDYAGGGVEVGDAGTAVFWYKPKDCETYKVIYGDLSVRDVAPEDLPKAPEAPAAGDENAAD